MTSTTMINYCKTCLFLLLGITRVLGVDLPQLEVVLRANDSVRGGVTRYYHGDKCEVGFPTNGALWSQIWGSEGLWHIDFRPNSNSFCTNNTDPTQMRYKLQRDGNFVARCRGSLDYMTHSHQNDPGSYMLVIDGGCKLHILDGTIGCNAVSIWREIWASDRNEALGPGDRLNKGQVLHNPSYMILKPDSGNLELREALSHGTSEVLWSSDWEWDAPPGPQFHDYYAKVRQNGHLILVGIEYGSSLKETVYFDKDLHSNGADCFTLGYEPNEEYLGPANLIAVPCDGTDMTVLCIAKYDWVNGAKDISGSPLKHDGVLEPDTNVQGGTLYIDTDFAKVDLGLMPELNEASKVLFRLEDVVLHEFPSGGAVGRYTILLGGGSGQWWVGVRHDNRGEVGTYLAFNIGGWDNPNYEFEVQVSEEFHTSLFRLEYRYDGMAPPDKRLAIRYNEGEWYEGGWSDTFHFQTFPTSDETVQINDGARADWDAGMYSIGTVWIYAGA